ncbi:AmmeMemoRadiSam system protein B [Halorhabdus sp. CUG00001]|uniref:AmmeMemoRadiSam system protein B n=1 Tax=Halorhabdus sp. CUG00001 TaxID=2600297 RepID=UPI00131C9347|nr:AmmeMemoRadiSam system protein B [Halorhabdus sp. CUG00001]
MAGVREPAVAGRFYASQAEALQEQLRACYDHQIGPGTRPSPPAGTPAVAGLLTPHAGLPFSGPVAAHAYAALGTGGTPETVVVIGPNHTGIGANIAIPGHDAWQTPLGTVPIDGTVREQLVETTDATVDNRAHAREHATEVQLPFLQELYDSVSVLPISLRQQDEATARELGSAIAETLTERTVLIASSDFTHYEPHDVAMARDELALDPIREHDPDALIETVEREALSVCGYGAIATLLYALEGSVDVLAHASSGETAGSMAEVVGYGAVAIES